MNTQSNSWQHRPAPVVVAVDLGPRSAVAVLAGARAADRVGAALILLHVVHDPVDAPGFYHRRQIAGGLLRPIQELARDMAVEFLAEQRREHRELKSLARAQWAIVKGLPRQRIVEASNRLGAGLLVVGAAEDGRSRIGLHQPLSAWLVAHCREPVMVVAQEGVPEGVAEQGAAMRQVERAYGALAA